MRIRRPETRIRHLSGSYAFVHLTSRPNNGVPVVRMGKARGVALCLSRAHLCRRHQIILVPSQQPAMTDRPI